VNLCRGTNQKLLIFRRDRGNKISNEPTLNRKRFRFGQADGRNPHKGAVRYDSAQAVFQFNDLSVKRSGRHVISDPHPIADWFEPLWALSDQSGELAWR
jgi:hypothetical protein